MTFGRGSRFLRTFFNFLQDFFLTTTFSGSNEFINCFKRDSSNLKQKKLLVILNMFLLNTQPFVKYLR